MHEMAHAGPWFGSYCLNDSYASVYFPALALRVFLLADAYRSAVCINWNSEAQHKITHATMGCSKLNSQNTSSISGAHVIIL